MLDRNAELADVLKSGIKSSVLDLLLSIADALFASVVIGPAVIVYWRSTWTLMDLYVFPDDLVSSATVCTAVGMMFGILFTVFQHHLSNFVRPELGKLPYYVMSRLCTCIAGVTCVSVSRGTWVLLDECTGVGAQIVFLITVPSLLTLMALMAFRNVCGVPFAVIIDTPREYFEVPLRFRTNSRETMLYILDCIFSVAVVGSLVVFVWRGSWALLDIFLFPDDRVRSCWTSLIGGYALVVVTFALQAPVRWAASRLHGAPRLLLADLYHLISFVATVNVWRGVWGLLDVYFFPDSPKLSNWSSHIISLAFLILLNCSNSIIVRGVYIDAEEPAGECVVFPCHYLRLFFHKERTKKRHKRIIQAAAASKIPDVSEASLPLQIPEEKV